MKPGTGRMKSRNQRGKELVHTAGKRVPFSDRGPLHVALQCSSKGFNSRPLSYVIYCRSSVCVPVAWLTRVGGDGVPSRSRAPGEYKGLSWKTECGGPKGIYFISTTARCEPGTSSHGQPSVSELLPTLFLALLCELDPYTVRAWTVHSITIVSQENGEPAIAWYRFRDLGFRHSAGRLCLYSSELGILLQLEYSACLKTLKWFFA